MGRKPISRELFDGKGGKNGMSKHFVSSIPSSVFYGNQKKSLRIMMNKKRNGHKKLNNRTKRDRVIYSWPRTVEAAQDPFLNDTQKNKMLYMLAINVFPYKKILVPSDSDEEENLTPTSASETDPNVQESSNASPEPIQHIRQGRRPALKKKPPNCRTAEKDLSWRTVAYRKPQVQRRLGTKPGRRIADEATVLSAIDCVVATYAKKYNGFPVSSWASGSESGSTTVTAESSESGSVSGNTDISVIESTPNSPDNALFRVNLPPKQNLSLRKTPNSTEAVKPPIYNGNRISDESGILDVIQCVIDRYAKKYKVSKRETTSTTRRRKPRPRARRVPQVASSNNEIHKKNQGPSEPQALVKNNAQADGGDSSGEEELGDPLIVKLNVAKLPPRVPKPMASTYTDNTNRITDEKTILDVIESVTRRYALKHNVATSDIKQSKSETETNKTAKSTHRTYRNAVLSGSNSSSIAKSSNPPVVVINDSSEEEDEPLFVRVNIG